MEMTGRSAALYEGIAFPGAGARKQECWTHWDSWKDRSDHSGVRPTSFILEYVTVARYDCWSDLGDATKTAGEATAASCIIAIDDSDSTTRSNVRLKS